MKKYLLLLMLTIIAQKMYSQEFITRWNLNFPLTNQIKFRAATTGIVNYSWETIPAGISGSGFFSDTVVLITGLPAGSIIRLKIEPNNFIRFRMGNTTTNQNLIDVENWGSVSWVSMREAFQDCINLNISSLDLPNLSSVIDYSYMFENCFSLNGPSNIGSWNTGAAKYLKCTFHNAVLFNQDIGSWNTTSALDMSSMFNSASLFNQDIGNWNTGMVKDMNAMFLGAESFNKDIGNWNTGSVKDMNHMFHNAHSFNQDIGDWNTGSVKDMNHMFSGATLFNQDIGNWNTGLVESMWHMFSHDSSFNQDIGNWDTHNVVIMGSMFAGATSFNQDIGNWNTGSVLNMWAMFVFAHSFNQDIGNWNTSSVEDMQWMFYDAKAFNQDIGNWNTGSVHNMNHMFAYASSFNQNIGSWNTSSVEYMDAIFYNAKSFNHNIGNWQLHPNVTLNSALDSCGMNCYNYSSTLISWSNNINIPTSRNLGSATMNCSAYAVPNRDFLINTKGWNISGDNITTTDCAPTQTFFHDDENTVRISINPNPATQKARFEILVDKAQEANIIVYDGFGGIFFENKALLNIGYNSYFITTENLPSGIYNVRISLANTVYNNKMTVIR